MGDLAKKTTITAEALANLIEVLKGKPNLSVLASAFLDQLQDVENASFELIDERTIDASVGIQLDRLGQIIGLARGGLSDDDYRSRLKAQIKINRSSGTVEELLEILALLETQTLELTQSPPAGFTITVIQPTADPDLLALIIRDAKAGGVGGDLHITLSPDSEVFRFATGDTEEASTTQGHGNDGGTTGGKFADVV